MLYFKASYSVAKLKKAFPLTFPFFTNKVYDNNMKFYSLAIAFIYFLNAITVTKSLNFYPYLYPKGHF